MAQVFLQQQALVPELALEQAQVLEQVLPQLVQALVPARELELRRLAQVLALPQLVQQQVLLRQRVPQQREQLLL